MLKKGHCQLYKPFNVEIRQKKTMSLNSIGTMCLWCVIAILPDRDKMLND